VGGISQKGGTPSIIIRRGMAGDHLTNTKITIKFLNLITNTPTLLLPLLEGDIANPIPPTTSKPDNINIISNLPDLLPTHPLMEPLFIHNNTTSSSSSNHYLSINPPPPPNPKPNTSRLYLSPTLPSTPALCTTNPTYPRRAAARSRRQRRVLRLLVGVCSLLMAIWFLPLSFLQTSLNPQ